MARCSLEGSRQLMYTSNESLEALRQQLFCTYVELDYIRRASELQAKYTDAKLQKLQAMLYATQKERDGAIQICNKLQQHLLHLSNDSMQPNQHTSPTMHAVASSSSWNNSITNHSNTIPEIHIMRSAHTVSKPSTMAGSEPFEGNNLAIDTLEQYGLPVFDKDNTWEQKDMSFSDSNENFSIDIFNELDSLELPELPEEKNLVSEWEADLTKSWEASLSSSSSANSPAASQTLTEASADKCLCLSNSSKTGSPINSSTKMEANLLVSDPYTIGSQPPIATMGQGTPSSASSNIISLSAHTPITTQSMQANASCRITPNSESLSASANVYTSSPLSTSAKASPSTSASLSQLPIASKSNHLHMSAKPLTSLLAVPASPSVHSLARRPNCLPMSAALNSSITCTLAPTPLFPALAIPMHKSQSLATPTFQHLGMIQEAAMPSSFTSSPNTPHVSPLSKCQSKPLFSTHFSTVSTRNTSSKIDQAPSLVLPQKRRHLPEPPEANMDVMLSTLPKKGKLLEAVMQAGPLLQQLILAGPMPQWQHPPPQLKKAHIPRVPTSPNSILSPFSHVQYSPTLGSYASQLPFTSTL